MSDKTSFADGQPSDFASADFHFNTRTGAVCNCPWGASKRHRSHRRRRNASVGVRKVRNRNMKAFRTDAGQRYLNELEKWVEKSPQIREPIAEYLAARYPHGEVGYIPGMGHGYVLPHHIEYYTDPDRSARRIQEYKSDPRYYPAWASAPDEFTDGKHLRDWMETLDQSAQPRDHSIPFRAFGPREAELLSQYVNARQHPLRRGQNIMQMPLGDMRELAGQLEEELRQKREKESWLADWINPGEVRHRFPNGWHVNELLNSEDLEAESDALGHCIGSDEQPYREALDRGRIRAFSLRDPEGYPHMTWHHNSDGSLAHVQGRSGRPKPEYMDMFHEHQNQYGFPTEEVGEHSVYDPHVMVPALWTVDDFRSAHHPRYGDAITAAQEHVPDAWIGDDTEIEFEPPNWTAMAEGAAHNYGHDPVALRDFFHNVSHGGYNHITGQDYHEGLRNAINNHPDINTPEMQNLKQQFDEHDKKSYFNGEFAAPYYDWNKADWTSGYDLHATPLFREPGPHSGPDAPAWQYVQPPEYPGQRQVYYGSTVHWFSPNPGDAVIIAEGGTADNRAFAEQYTKILLEAYGFKRVAFDIEGTFEKTGEWKDIEAKAVRLINSGNVTILRNGWNVVAGHVIGDHGEYDAEIGRDDPTSRAITTWQCECPWDQYAWQRTRKWKKYEGRPCAHVMALYWLSLGTPLDDYNPEEHGPLPPGQTKSPTPLELQESGRPGEGGEAPPEEGQPSLPGMEQYGPVPESSPAQAPMAPPAEPGHLPTPPMDMQQQAPPIPGTAPGGTTAPPGTPSVPGARLPSPYNPIQYPGGTYSATGDVFVPPEIVRLNESVYGLAEGKSEEHGAGQYKEVPQGSTGEVLDQDKTTGWVEVIFPLKGGELTPYHVRCFLEPSQISKTDHQPPGPFIRRHT